MKFVDKQGIKSIFFWSFRGGKHAHISRELPNKHLINLGYEGLLTAHEMRQLALTAGKDVFKGDALLGTRIGEVLTGNANGSISCVLYVVLIGQNSLILYL